MDNKEFFINGGIPPQQLQYDQQFITTMPTWQSLANSIEIQTNQSQDYESALSSMVSSPVASNSALSTDNFMIRELIEEENKAGDDNQKAPEPTKDYIHVRARRGQATDSHSLAERVTGKALMLDEIINYVQSLQRQVEGIQPNCTLTHPMYPTMVPTQYGQPHQNPLRDCIPTIGATTVPCPMDPLNPTLNHNHSSHLSSIHAFSNCLPQLPSLCEGDLQSIVQMGFLQMDDGFQTQTSQGTNPTQMKIEL
ncbi:hypothetical protein KSS87_009236 [Heliosperma pusillum]|nr:hypothetical protein KSS87_009236 [Heliosperma pusillum]